MNLRRGEKKQREPETKWHNVLFYGPKPYMVTVAEEGIEEYDLIPHLHHNRDIRGVLLAGALPGAGTLFFVGPIILIFVAALMGGGYLGLYAGLVAAFGLAGGIAVWRVWKVGNRRKGLLVLRKSGKGKNEAWRPVVFEAPLSGNVQTAAALYGLYVEPLSQMVFERVANLGETLIKSSPLLIALGIVSAGIFFLTQ